VSSQTAIDQARLRPGRYVWFSRIPFVLFAFGGGALIVGLKLHGWEQVWVTSAACALIVAYGVVVLAIPILRIREDQLGDNTYYLGFLYTLVSLCLALYEFGYRGRVEDIVSNFSIALGSTIVGIVLRVFFNQARRDVLETEREARMELAQAVVRLRTEVDDAVLALSSFYRITQQTASEQINAVATNTTEVLRSSIAKVGDTATEAMTKIDTALSAFIEHSSALNKASADTVKAVKSLLTRIEKIEAPSDLVSRRLEPVLAALDVVGLQIREQLESDQTLLRTVKEETRALQHGMATAVAAVNESAQQLTTAAASNQEASASSQLAASRMTELVNATDKSIEVQARFAESARSEGERVLAALKAHNDGLEAELERARRIVGQTSAALSTLAETITERLK
jgi:hypothetical protein